MRFKRGIVAGLLISLVPMLVVPFLGSSRYNGAERHVEWLRGQLTEDGSELIDRAIESALLSEAHNLQLFIEAFVAAYYEERGSGSEDFHIDIVLKELLQRHWQQLIGEGVVPYLSLKSLLARSSIVRDRSALSTQFLLQKKGTIVRLSPAWSQYVTTVQTLLIPLLLNSFTLLPRGP